MSTPPPPHHRDRCISCAYPLNVDGDIFAVLSRVKQMMAHVGYTVDRLLVEESRDSAATKSVTLLLRPNFSPASKRTHPDPPQLDHSQDHPVKRLAVPGCKLCASSCCSTNSLCKANVCHHAEENSLPTPSSPTQQQQQQRHRPVSAKNHVHSYAGTNTRKNTPSAPSHSQSHKHHHQTRKPHPPFTVANPDISARPTSHTHTKHIRPQAPAIPEKQPQTSADLPAHPRLPTPSSRQKHADGTSHLDAQPQDLDRPPASAPAVSFAQSRLIPADGMPQCHSLPIEHSHDKETPSRWLAVAPREAPTVDPSCTAAAAAARLGSDMEIVDGASGTALVAQSRSAASAADKGPTDNQRNSLTSRLTTTNANLVPDSRDEYEDALKQPSDMASGPTQGVQSLGADAAKLPISLTCQPCRLNFPVELELRRHEFMEHKDTRIGIKTREGRFMCLMHSCKQSFVRRHVMERHFKSVHLLVRDFPCPSCEKSFADSSTRAAHRSAVHEKRKPYVCDHCPSSFTQSSSLGKHRRRFHQENLSSGARPT